MWYLTDKYVQSAGCARDFSRAEQSMWPCKEPDMISASRLCRQTCFHSSHQFRKPEAGLFKADIPVTCVHGATERRMPPVIFLYRMAGFFLLLLLMGHSGTAQQPTQPLQSFGYVGVADYLSTHPGARIAADWDFFGADPPDNTPDAIVDLTGKFQILQANIGANGQPQPVKAYIDVSRVFFQQVQDLPTPIWALRFDYLSRWNQFKIAQGIYFQPDQIDRYVYAFNVFNEPTFRGVPLSDVQRAAAVLRCPVTPDPFNSNPDCQSAGGFPFIPTSVVEAANQVADPGYLAFTLADYVDWYGADWYGVRPSRSSIITNAFLHLDSMMVPLVHSQKKIAFAFDGFYEPAIHSCVA